MALAAVLAWPANVYAAAHPESTSHAAAVNYNIGVVYTYAYEVHLQSFGFSNRNHQGTATNPDTQRVSCSCDVTAVRQFSDNEFLLHLEIYDMQQEIIDRYGNKRVMQHAGDNDIRMQRDFFFVQRYDGRVTHCFYPADEDPEIVNMKKGMANHFRTFLSNVDTMEAEEEDHHGRHNVTYSVSSYGDKTTVIRDRIHDNAQYGIVKQQSHRNMDGFQDSEVRESHQVEIERNTGKIQAVTSVHIARLESKPPRYIDEVPEDFVFEFQAHADINTKLQLVGEAHTLSERKRGLRESEADELVGLTQDNLVATMAVHFSSEEAEIDQPSISEVFECFERDAHDSTCAIQLHRILRHDAHALDAHLAQIEHLSSARQAVVLDALPDIGSRSLQLWLATYLDGRNTSSRAQSELTLRAVTSTHFMLDPQPELVTSLWKLSQGIWALISPKSRIS